MEKIRGLHHEGPEAQRQPDPVRTNGTIAHYNYAAIQYEFYIPRQIWNSQAVQLFIQRLASLESGATILPRVVGVWMGDTEGTRIYRKVIRAERFSREQLRERIEDEIATLMQGLSAADRQQAVLFTESELLVSLSRDVDRGYPVM